MLSARRVREALGFSQAEVERQTGIDSSNLAKFELRGVGLGRRYLQRLAALYGCKIDDLIAEEPEPELIHLEWPLAGRDGGRG